MKTALVTGGSRGIGAAITRGLRAQGWQTAFTYEKNAEAASALARETGALAFQCDNRDAKAVQALRDELMRKWRHLDALVCNAGVAWSGVLQDMPVEAWDNLFDVNVRGAFLYTRACLDDMIHAGQGSIVYVSSMWGQVGASCEAAYSASKAALIGLTRALAQEVGPSGVRVNCVAPGVIRTDMLNCYTNDDLMELADQTPLNRLGTPEDVANAVLFLCSEQANFITGHVLSVNGGFITI